ncbi:MAG: PAS domain S-box protein [Bacteriovorax sp.]|jgi:PAS domain S-box-containing protein
MPDSNNGGFNDSNSSLYALLQCMVEGVLLQDSTGKIIQFNQSALDILGLTEEKLLSQDFIDPLRQDKIFPGKNHIGMNSLKTGEIQRNIVLNIFRTDGEMRWISLNAVPIFSHDKNKLPHLISTFTDITEMKKILSELNQVQLLFNISHDLMIIANKEGFFKRVNPRFQDVLGYFLSEIISQKFINFVHPEDLLSTQIELKKIESGKRTIHFINRYRSKKGDYRVFDWVVVPDSESGLIYFTARDITDYKAEELDLIHSSKVYSIGEVTSGIAYVIHGQLAIIGGHLAFIQDQIEKGQVEPGELKIKIQSIDESVQRLSKTTKDLTSFARETQHEQVANVSVAKMLESVLGLCRERFRIHGVKLDIQIEDDPLIRCRESQIEHVLITLLNDAYNKVHSQRDSWVQVLVTTQGDVIKILIADSAPAERDGKYLNIPAGIIEENFGTFYFDRSSPNTKFVLEFPLMKENINSDISNIDEQL